MCKGYVVFLPIRSNDTVGASITSCDLFDDDFITSIGTTVAINNNTSILFQFGAIFHEFHIRIGITLDMDHQRRRGILDQLGVLQLDHENGKVGGLPFFTFSSRDWKLVNTKIRTLAQNGTMKMENFFFGFYTDCTSLRLVLLRMFY